MAPSHLDALLRQKILETLKVFVSKFRPAVQGQHLDPAVADLLRPNVKLPAIDRNHSRSAGFHFAGWSRGFVDFLCRVRKSVGR